MFTWCGAGYFIQLNDFISTSRRLAVSLQMEMAQYQKCMPKAHNTRGQEIGHIFESFSPTCMNLLSSSDSFFLRPSSFSPSLLLCFLCCNSSPSVITHILPLQNRLSLADFLSGSTSRETGSELGCIDSGSIYANGSILNALEDQIV